MYKTRFQCFKVHDNHQANQMTLLDGMMFDSYAVPHLCILSACSSFRKLFGSTAITAAS